VRGDASSVIVIAAMYEPVDAGVNSVTIVQLLPAATLAAQLLNSLKPVAPDPDIAMLAISNSLPPVLESVTSRGELDVPSATAPNATEDADISAVDGASTAIIVPPQPDK